MNGIMYITVLEMTVLIISTGCTEYVDTPLPSGGTNNSVYQGRESDFQERPFVEGQSAPIPPSGFAWCLETRPAISRTVNEQAIVRPATSYLETVPARYESRTEKIMVEPEQHKMKLVSAAVYRDVPEQRISSAATVGYKVIPAQNQWVNEEMEVVPERTEKVFTPARYEDRCERIQTQPERTIRENVPGCDKETKLDCYSSRTIPAEYTTITRKQEIAPATTQTRKIPPVMKTTRVCRVVSPARVEKVDIPVQYETVMRKVLDRPAEYKDETLPARYTSIEKEILVTQETQRMIQVPAKYGMVCRVEVVTPERLVWVLRKNPDLSCRM